ncbi:hypothetical protein SZ54_0244 [Rhizobium sp. UR51a]|nr:hypothetical protein SZ54_0244 [Rhizobium sp. UR51a]
MTGVVGLKPIVRIPVNERRLPCPRRPAPAMFQQTGETSHV